MSARLFRSIRSGSHLSKPVVITIGNFDGVHLGHRKLIHKVVELKGLQGVGVLLSFYPHPDLVLKKSGEVPRIDSLALNLNKLGEAGIDLVFLKRFSTAFAQLEWREFLDDIVIKQLGCSALIIGPDARVGHRGEGDAEKIQEYLTSRGVGVHLVPFERIDQQPISSRRIRELLISGDICQANALLGDPFSYHGRVVRGEGRGKTIGFPTANLRQGHQIIPRTGVYLTKLEWQGVNYRSVTNIGIRPTFGGDAQTIETHILDFTDNLYGHKVTLQFLARIRSEQKFNSVCELKDQIALDIEHARGAFT